MRTRAFYLFPVSLAGLLLSGCLATTPPAKPAAGSTPAAVNPLPSSSAAVVTADLPAPPQPEAKVTAEPAQAAGEPAAPVTPGAPAPAVETTPSPESPGAGRIVRVNARLHYVLLDVSGRLHTGQDVVVFRDGEAVGRLRMSAPRQGRYASADILDGDVREGDLIK